MLFDDHYQVFLANGVHSEDLHFAVRYRVYCEERGFEDRQQFPEGLEHDRWDPFSFKFIVRCRLSGEYVAAMRLVRSSSGQLPLHSHCQVAPGWWTQLPGQSIVELSRLCVLRSHSGNFWDMKRAAKGAVYEPGIFWGMVRAAFSVSQDEEIGQWYFLTTRALARRLQQCMIHTDQVGEPCELNGTRHPYLVDVERSRQRIMTESPQLRRFYYSEPFCRRLGDLDPQPQKSPHRPATQPAIML